MLYYYSIFGLFSIVCMMMVIDQNVSSYIILQSKILQTKIERIFWMIRLHPKNPIVNLIKRWEYAKIAKELEKEFNSSK